MPVDEPFRGTRRIGMSRYFSQPSKAFFSIGEMHNIIDVTRFGDVTDHHHQACAIVEQLLQAEHLSLDQYLGGGDIQPNKKRKK